MTVRSARASPSPSPSPPPALRERLAGGALALYLVAGTWSLARVTGVEPTLFAQPRSWAVALLLVLAVSPGSGRPSRAPGLLGAELVWLGFTLLALTWAPDLELARVDALDLGMLMTVAVCVHRLARGGQVEALTAGLRTCLTGVLLLLAGVALLAGLGGERLAVLGGGPNVFGRNMGLLCLLALDRTLRTRPDASVGSAEHRGGPATLGWAAIATLAAALVILSGSRGAMIATAIAAPLLLLLGRGQVARKTVVIVGIVGLGLAGVLLTPIGAQVTERFSARVLDLLLADGYVSGRDRIYTIALERGAEQPLVGHGLAGFAAHTPWPYAHNLVLDAWFETGAVGVALLGVYLGGFARGVARAKTRGREIWLAAAALILVAAQFSGGRYDARGLLVFASLSLAVPGPPRRRSERVSP